MDYTRRSPNFSETFEKNGSKPFNYKGRNIHQILWYSNSGRQKYSVIFESTHGPRRHGVAIRFNGNIEVAGKKISRIWWMFCDEGDTEFTCLPNCTAFIIYNCFQWPDNVAIASKIYGCAFWLEDVPNGKRFHCNDGFRGDDFDDLVFRLEVLSDE